MAAELGLQVAGRYLVWRSEKPNCLRPLKSDVFMVQDFECHFELCASGGFLGLEYEIRMLDTKGQMIPYAFDITTYVEYGEEKISLTRGATFGDKIKTFYFGELERLIPDYYSLESLLFVFIFHGVVGLTLQLPHNKKDTYEETCRIESLVCLSTDMSKLLNEGSNHDLILKCGDRTFKAHRNILSARSEVFQAMLQSNMVEDRTGQVEIQDMEPDIFQGFLQFLYSGEMPKISPDNAKSFYEAGDKYMMKGLVKFCATFLFTNLTMENACNILILADAHSDQYLKEGAITYILNNKIPMQDDLWLPFSDSHVKLANEVLTRAYKLQIKNNQDVIGVIYNKGTDLEADQLAQGPSFSGGSMGPRKKSARKSCGYSRGRRAGYK